MTAPTGQPGSGGFGTFKGVYAPTILTIVGVVMYLRLGWVVGNVGLGLTLLMITMAGLAILLTALSISATATNMKVGSGGAYYLISRSLGVEAGAAVGLPLFFAQALGVSFYVVGFAEALAAVAPVVLQPVVGVTALVVIGALALRSTDLALKSQYLMLGLLAVSLVVFFAGSSLPIEAGDAREAPARLPFWAVFAVFFPAMTGIECGIALSGELRDPARSIPRGTIAAVVTGWIAYIAIAIVLADRVPADVLRADPFVMREVARFGDVILLGTWGAALSNAMASFVGAPRTLQALATDRVLPRIVAREWGASGEPRLATAITFVIALIGILAGDLNVLAPVLSIFFLTAYGFLNVSAGVEGLIGSPSWRPRFRVAWWLSILGAAICFGLMFMISAGATLIAGAVSALVFYFVHRREMRTYWGDTRNGMLMLLARFAIYRLAERKPDERTWRPNILVLSGSPASRWYLIELADALTHGRGFLTVAAIVPAGSGAAGRVPEVERSIGDYLRKRGVAALVEVVVADDVLQGADTLIQASGIGPVFPNTVLLGETERPENLLGYARLLRRARALERNVIMVREAEEVTVPRKASRIDVWLGPEPQNAALMIALGHILLASSHWDEARVVLKSIAENEEERQQALRRLASMVERGRLSVDIEVMVAEFEQRFERIRHDSADADLVLLGARPPAPGERDSDYAIYYSKLLDDTEGLPATGLVLAAEKITFTRLLE